eukprot:CAMPEP_0119321442 /NCGR_PEP_ID=MMETSP1333-20130426/55408_1 /TAXON_ID=418940 /ORGANISM="Scyphosphaera apsteinii, Strain RCC1455" /LENGTH=31 /DNA_ID= /DNA_START= /DNA_END= /DNA_ORIENTATION=
MKRGCCARKVANHFVSLADATRMRLSRYGSG